jgi:hypothetical protein
MDNKYMVTDAEKSNSTQNIPQEATKLNKLPKVTAARYMEMEQFKDSEHHNTVISTIIAYNFETKSLQYCIG